MRWPRWRFPRELDWTDGVITLGCGVVVYGVSLIFEPAAYLVGGGMLIGAGLLLGQR
jgi:hypothetical protein